MPVTPNFWTRSALGVLFWISASSPAGAQQVYKCPSRGAVTYSQLPCPGRIISTEQAPVPAKPNPKNLDLHKLEENRAMARALRRKPEESTGQFETRRRRTAMLAHDRAECARIDTRMPVEAASLTNPDPTEVTKAEVALRNSKKRFGELRC